MRDKKVWLGMLALVGIIAPFSNAANAAENNLLTKKQVITTAATHKVAFSVSRAYTLKKYENAHTLTDLQLIELLKAVGFKGSGLKTAWAVAKAESNGRPFAFNGNVKTGDSSYGMFQINMIGQLGPDRRDKYNLDVNAELFSPVKNAQIVYEMTQGGKNWKAWKYAKTPAVKKWLKKFPATTGRV